jgi:hypothetical protein
MNPSSALQNALDHALEATDALAVRALHSPVTLTRIPPLHHAPSAYGDLVPLGLVLLALEQAAARGRTHWSALAQALRAHLMAQRTRQLWPFQSGGLETSIDSGFVLLGVADRAAIAELERFNVGGGRYVPQLFSPEPEPGKMLQHAALRHWCQPDYSIACLVRALRGQSGLPTVTPLAELAMGFAQRSGLYLANPYWTDWWLALALVGDVEAEPLRAQLRDEISASRTSEGLFGKYDTALCTALALLALQALGAEAAALTPSYEALAALVAAERVCPAQPFYSTEQLAWSQLPPWELIHLLLSEQRQQLIRVGAHEHAITFYRDTEGLVVYPLIALALLNAAPVAGATDTAVTAAPHARYSCATPADYIAGFALPPYLA